MINSLSDTGVGNAISALTEYIVMWPFEMSITMTRALTRTSLLSVLKPFDYENQKHYQYLNDGLTSFNPAR